jgi:protein gp37
MGENTKIQWAHYTFNAWIGCEKVSEACKFCYAEQYAKRYSIAEWGNKGTRYKTVQDNWNKLIRWNRKAEKDRQRRRVFCFSLSDIMEDSLLIPQGWREEFYALVRKCTWLDFLFLTKRPENYVRFLPSDWGDGYDNVWLGVSIENQRRYDERAPFLKLIKAKVKFFSMEPMLEYVRMEWKPDWVIIGGESGFKKDARELNLKTVQLTVELLKAAETAVFFKQLGTIVASKLKLSDDKGGNFDEYPEQLEGLKIRQLPMAAYIAMAQTALNLEAENHNYYEQLKADLPNE